MLVQFWKYFNKKEKSTARPSLPPDEALNLQVYAPCSMTNPRFKLPVDAGRFYYCAVPLYGRWYHLTDISYEGTFQICSYEEDIAASYRGEIGSTKCMISRAAAKSNPNIIDPLRVVESGCKYKLTTSDYWFGKGAGYLVQYSGDTGVENVWIGEHQFRELMSALWLTWSKISGITDVIKAAVDPAQYILSVQKCLIADNAWIDTENAESIPVVLGGMPLLNSSGGAIYAARVGDFRTLRTPISIPKHPQSETLPFLKGSRYSSYSLKVPGAGWTELNADDLYDYDTLNIVTTIDNINGKMRNSIIVDGKTIAEIIGQGTVPFALSAANVEVGATITGLVSGLVSSATGNVLGTFGGVGTAVGSLIPTVTNRGAMGSAIGVTDKPELILRYQVVGDIDPETQGNPVAEIGTVSSYPGYIKCIDPAPVLKGATAPEMTAVINLMEGGFYYE